MMQIFLILVYSSSWRFFTCAESSRLESIHALNSTTPGLLGRAASRLGQLACLGGAAIAFPLTGNFIHTKLTSMGLIRPASDSLKLDIVLPAEFDARSFHPWFPERSEPRELNLMGTCWLQATFQMLRIRHFVQTQENIMFSCSDIFRQTHGKRQSPFRKLLMGESTGSLQPYIANICKQVDFEYQDREGRKKTAVLHDVSFTTGDGRVHINSDWEPSREERQLMRYHVMKEVITTGAVAVDTVRWPSRGIEKGITEVPDYFSGHSLVLVGWGEDEISRRPFWHVLNSDSFFSGSTSPYGKVYMESADGQREFIRDSFSASILPTGRIDVEQINARLAKYRLQNGTD